MINKKLFLTVCLILVMMQMPVQAEISYSCSEGPYPVASKAGNFLHTITGINFLSRKSVEKVIRSNLEKETGSDFKVDLSMFSATDLKSGKFKSLKVNSDEANIGGLFVHNLSASTQCGYNRIVFKKDAAPLVYEDFLVDFSAKITNDDLQKTLSSENYQKYLKSINLGVGKFKVLQVDKPTLQIVNNKLRYSFRVTANALLSELSQDVVCDMDLAVNDGQLNLANIKINNKGFMASDAIYKLVNRINPFKIDLEKSLNIPSHVNIQHVSFKDNAILLSGVFVAPKNSELAN